MKALRIVAAAVAIAAATHGIADKAEAKGWVVRVELRNQFTGEYMYPTLYSSEYYSDAQIEYAWYEYLMKVHPQKFRSDVLDPMGIPWYWKPDTQKMYLIFLRGIFPTGR